MSDWLAFWDYDEATWAGLQFLVLVVAAVVAWRQVHEARRLREAQAQPFVVVDFEIEKHRINIVITNTGTTMARNVRMTFEPELRSSWDDEPGITPLRETKLFKEGIPSLPPGKVHRAMLDTAFRRDPENLPDVYHVKVRYDAPAVHKKGLTDETVLDLGVYRNLLRATERDLTDVHDRLKDIAKEMGKWTAFGKGLLTVTPASQRRRSNEGDWASSAYHERRLVKRVYYRGRLALSRALHG